MNVPSTTMEELSLGLPFRDGDLEKHILYNLHILKISTYNTINIILV